MMWGRGRNYVGNIGCCVAMTDRVWSYRMMCGVMKGNLELCRMMWSYAGQCGVMQDDVW